MIELKKKLGLREGMTLILDYAPDNYLSTLNISKDDYSIVPGSNERTVDFIHIFETDTEKLIVILEKLCPMIKWDGMIWISWPKKSSGIISDLDKFSVMKIGLNAGLVDVKIVAINDDWSALKFVYRLDDRQEADPGLEF